jgi:chaperone required for assembly of F1-ATPase
VKRFWKDVSVGEDNGVSLDGRPVRTPGRTPLLLPTRALADAVADEWRSVEGDLDPRAMMLTGLANAATDRIAAGRAAFAEGLARYGESDVTCYRADTPPDLAAAQAAAWDPVLDWVRTRYDVHLEPVSGVMHRPQPPATLARLGEVVGALDAWQLAGLSPVVTTTGSLLIALMLREGVLDAEAGWAAANLDEDWQAERWGRDLLAEQAMANRRRDYDAGLRFGRLAAS